MNIEFNPDGSLKLPENIAESRKKFKDKLRKAEQNPNKVSVKFKDTIDNYECQWEIVLPKNISSKILWRIRFWANGKHKLFGGSSWIEKEGNHFLLIIKGHKNRCVWCHSFLNGLNTFLLRTFATKIKQKNTCEYNFYVKEMI